MQIRYARVLVPNNPHRRPPLCRDPRKKPTPLQRPVQEELQLPPLRLKIDYWRKGPASTEMDAKDKEEGEDSIRIAHLREYPQSRQSVIPASENMWLVSKGFRSGDTTTQRAPVHEHAAPHIPNYETDFSASLPTPSLCEDWQMRHRKVRSPKLAGPTGRQPNSSSYALSETLSYGLLIAGSPREGAGSPTYSLLRQ